MYLIYDLYGNDPKIQYNDEVTFTNSCPVTPTSFVEKSPLFPLIWNVTSDEH
jgi:hypothetical protein